MEVREVTRFPSLTEPRLAQIPGGANLARYVPQVLPEVVDRGPAPEPVPVVDLVDDEMRLEHEGVRDQRVVHRVGVLLDIEVLLDGALGVGEEGPLGADGGPELL